MAKYDPKSFRAEEFINDEEIRETLAYAEKNKNNRELIDEILEKARPIRTGNGARCTGLTHREASVLLACELEPVMTDVLISQMSLVGSVLVLGIGFNLLFDNKVVKVGNLLPAGLIPVFYQIIVNLF